MKLKGQFTQNENFCHHLLTLMLLQTCFCGTQILNDVLFALFHTLG